MGKREEEYEIVLEGQSDLNFQKLKIAKHRLQAMMRMGNSPNVQLSVKKDERKFGVYNYGGSKEELQNELEALFPKIDNVAFAGIKYSIEKSSGSKDKKNEQIDISDFKEEIDSLQDALTETVAENHSYRIKLKEATTQKKWLEKEYENLQHLKEREKDLEELDRMKTSYDDMVKTVNGLTNSYAKKSEEVKELKRKDADKQKKAGTAVDMRIAEVRESASALKRFEEEVKNIGMGENEVEMYLTFPQSLAEHVNECLGTSYKTVEEVKAAAKITETKRDEKIEQEYMEAQESLRFYDTIASAGVKPPKTMADAFAEMEKTIDEKRAFVAKYETERAAAEEANAKAMMIIHKIEWHQKADRVRSAFANAPKVQIYAQAGQMLQHMCPSVTILA
jgi:hypothetical protein